MKPASGAGATRRRSAQIPLRPRSLIASRFLGALLAALLAAPFLRALDPAAVPASYNVRHWDTEDGLPHNSIKQLFQTRDGYLWIGTNYGLARFDGLAFTVFNKNNTPAMRSPLITSMAETADGSLWVGTAAGLLRYRDGRFMRYDRASGLRGDTVNALCVAPDGSLWIGGREGLVRWAGGQFVRDIDTSGYDLLGMRNITVDQDGAVWIAYGIGALRYREGRVTPFGAAQGLPNQLVQTFTTDAVGRTLAVTHSGLHRLEGERFVPAQENADLSGLRINRTLVDRAGNLWVGSTGGLDRHYQGQVVPYIDRHARRFGVVDALWEDREGCLWIGSSDGLYRLTDRRATSLSQADGIVGTLINSVIQARDGSLWTGSWNGGVTRLHQGTTTRFTNGAPLSHDTVTAIYEAPDGAMWFGNRGSSLDRLQDGRVTTYVFPSGVATSRPVTTILADDDGTLLLGIAGRGLLQLKDDRIGVVPGAEALATARSTVWKIHRTANGRLLLGTNEGLYERRADRSWTPVALPGLAGTVAARDILEVSGVLWLATDGHGLVRWQGTEARAYREAQGMLDDSLFNVLDDGLGSFWVASARGIARVRKTELASLDRGASASLNLMTLGRNDGLLSSSAPGSGAPGATRLADGRLLFATDQGVAVVDPRLLQVNTRPPTVIIERLLAEDQPVPLDGKLELSPETTRLEIRFTALSLMAPQRLRFRYQLVGSDPTWVEAGQDRRANYTRLEPGRYVFRVIACNSDGVWSDTGSTVAFTIRPHFYQAWWFRAAAILTIAGLVFLATWLRDRRLHHREDELSRMNLELDQRVQARTAELANSLSLLEQAQQAAASEEARFKFIFDSVPVGIALVTGDGLHLTNPAHERITGVPEKDASEPGAFARASHPDDYRLQIERAGPFLRGEVEHYSVEKRYLHPDGRAVWAVLTSRRFTNRVSGVQQAITTLVDITERKAVEAQLAETHQQLLASSRQAGMAEVATGVLHNVGNVLNSLNVSSTLVSDGLRASKADSLARLASLLQEHAADLAGFLTSDPKGRRLPELMASLASHSLAERDRLLDEVASLQENVDHIRDIVTTQQTYATAASMAEPLDAGRLMEDALRMKKEKLQSIRVDRRFESTGRVLAEKSKVLQILINLIGNARQACDESPASPKVITLGVERAGDRVRLTVRDTGIGIAPENLTRIFAHGFTTKATGHGFGLHSAANAAREMKGSLTAASPGLGLGATFTLELPLAETAPPPAAAPAVDLVTASHESDPSSRV